jgi:hypothetical protein
MLAPVTSRDRKIRSGINGLAMRACRITKATISTTATPARPSVRAEVQPCCSTPKMV